MKQNTFPNTIPITSLGDNTFIECTALKDIRFPPHLLTIGQNCFSGCSSITDLVFPSTLETISANAFKDCSSLKTIKVCGSKQISTNNAFNINNADVTVYVTILYIYETFCGFPVKHELTINCELIQKPVKCTCKKSRPRAIPYLML